MEITQQIDNMQIGEDKRSSSSSSSDSNSSSGSSSVVHAQYVALLRTLLSFPQTHASLSVAAPHHSASVPTITPTSDPHSTVHTQHVLLSSYASRLFTLHTQLENTRDTITLIGDDLKQQLLKCQISADCIAAIKKGSDHATADAAHASAASTAAASAAATTASLLSVGIMIWYACSKIPESLTHDDQLHLLRYCTELFKREMKKKLSDTEEPLPWYTAVAGIRLLSTNSATPVRVEVVRVITSYPTHTDDGRNSILSQLVKIVSTADIHFQIHAARTIRQLLLIVSPPIQEVIDAGAVPVLVNVLRHSSHHSLLHEALWILTNIVSGTSGQTQVVVDHDTIPALMNILQSHNNADVIEQAVWCIGNIAGEAPKMRDLVVTAGALPFILQLLCKPQQTIQILRTAVWCVSLMCKTVPLSDFAVVKSALPAIAQLPLHVQDEEVLTDACWCLFYLSGDESPTHLQVQAVIASGVIPRLVELLRHNNTNVVTPALRTIGTVVMGDEDQTQTVLNCHVLPALRQLLNHSQKDIRKEACWTISNITAGTQEQIQQVIDADLIPALVSILSSNEEFEVKQRIAWALSNAANGASDEQMTRYLADHGVIESMCQLLACDDRKIIEGVLECLDNILHVGAADAENNDNPAGNEYVSRLESCGGTARVTALLQSDDSSICDQAASLIERYGLDESEEERRARRPVEEMELDEDERGPVRSR